MKIIERVKLHNFRKFADITIQLSSPLCVLVGENEAGKSSILQAINLVLTANRAQAEAIGVERLLNISTVQTYMASARAFENLPETYVELYFNDHQNIHIEGRNNSENVTSHGLRMVCAPNQDLGAEIRTILGQQDAVFPYDYYDISFYTFQGDHYTGNRRYIRSLMIDTSSVSAEYATRDYIARMYEASARPAERSAHLHSYRRLKDGYKANVLNDINQRLEEYDFALRTDAKSNLLNDLTLTKDNVGIESKGKGLQCFIKTAFALKRVENPNREIDTILLEEPENHLSHTNMQRLVSEISRATEKQLIIATHSNMLTARLDLRNAVMIQNASVARLADVSDGTAKFFIKAPNHGILDFVLSTKALLVEGDAEHILMEKLFETVTRRKPSDEKVHIISVGGLTFKRYMEVAAKLGKKVAVVRDNDGNHQRNCVDLYVDYVNEHIRVFGDADPGINTFEVAMYRQNAAICDAVFADARGNATTQEYMLKNKTEAAYALALDQRNPTVPGYIQDAIQWLVV